MALKSSFAGRSLGWLSGVACLVAASAASDHASACGACACDAPTTIVTLIRDVPLNLQLPLPVLEGETAEPRIERVSDGVAVPTSATRVVAPTDYWWLAAEGELEPRTEYRIVRSSGVDAQFTTGTARDEGAPSFDAVSPTAGGNADLCDESVGAQLVFSGVAEPGSLGFMVWAELEIEDGADTLRLFAPYGPDSSVRLGHTELGCFGSTELPALTAGQSYPMRARLRDASGNASEWKEAALTFAAEQPGGCGPPPETGSGGEAPSAAGAPSAGGTSSPTTAPGERTSSGCAISTEGPRAPAASFAALLSLAALLVSRRRPREDVRAGSRRDSHRD